MKGLITMCIAILKTKNGKISDEYLRNSFNNNSDGAGIAYTKNGELFVVKGIFDIDEFVKKVREAEKIADGAMLIHCRISTSGNIDELNCHPHVVNDRTVMIHNGILDVNVPKNSKVSDTIIFVRDYLSKLPKDFMVNKATIKLIELAIGSNNKFCFLNKNGQYAIAGEDKGEWVDGVWYSNSGYSYSWNSGFKCYGSYGDYDYADEYGYYSYGKSNKEDEKPYLTSAERMAIKRTIIGLNRKQLDLLGECPVYDLWTTELKPDTGNSDYFLFDLDDSLQYLYEAKYFEYENFDFENFDIDNNNVVSIASAEYGDIENRENEEVSTNEDAMAHIRNKFDEAYNSAWQYADDDELNDYQRYYA